MKHARVMNVVAGAVALACAAGAHAGTQQAAAMQSISYVAQDITFPLAYVITWDTVHHTAHIAETFGTADGSYTDDGVQRIITLDHPLVSTDYVYDCNGNVIPAEDDLLQLVLRSAGGAPKKGVTQLVPIGTVTDIGGCTPGQVTPYGSVTDAGYPMDRLAMSLRAPMDDLVAGAQIAGMTETPLAVPGDLGSLSADVTTFGAGSVTFNRTGHQFSTTLTADGWLVIDFGSFQRGYTRLTQDARSGEEIWLGAEWQDNAPGVLELSMMAKPNAQAGFGGRGAASHDWASGRFLNSYAPTDYAMYHDYTGLRTATPVDGSDPYLTAYTWGLGGTDLQLAISGANGVDRRTWTPVANHGKTHFVIESGEEYDANGNWLYTTILPRVNFFIDQGKTTKPAGQARAKTTASPLRGRLRQPQN